MAMLAKKSNVINIQEHMDIVSARKAARLITRVWGEQPGDYFFIGTARAGKRPKAGTPFGRDEFERVEDFIREHHRQNIWWCVHGFSEPHRKKEFAVDPNWLYGDLDKVDPDDLRVKPTVLFETSPGSYGGLWRMDKPVGFEVNKRLNYACAEDKGGWMTTKFLRVPYTINRKPNRKNPTVRVVWDDGPRYTVSSLNTALGVWSRVSEEGMRRLRLKYKGGDRSDHRASIVNQLIKERFSDAEIRDLFGNNNPWAGDSERKLVADIERLRKNPLRGQKPITPEFDPGRPETARKLQKKPKREFQWLVPGIFPQGVSTLGGRPKSGKSLMAMHLALAIAGGKNTLGYECEKGDVLYIMIEGGEDHLRRRISTFLGEDKKWPTRFFYYTKFPRFDEGALKFIKRWLDDVENPRLVVIDTLAAVKARVAQQTTTTDYDSVKPFSDLVTEYPGLSGILVAHTRKSAAEDPIDELSGTLGTAAAVDAINIIRREGGKTLFYGRGREMEEFNKVIELQFPTWRILGDEGKVTTADNPRKILDAIQNARKALTPKEIAEIANMDGDVVRTTLRRMLDKAEVRKVAHGKYDDVC